MKKAIFKASSLEAKYSYLDQCPEKFLSDIVTFPIGSLRERVSGLLAWRSALLAGSLPSKDVWPSWKIAHPIRKALQELGIVRFCKNEDDLVDDILRDVLNGLERQLTAFRSETRKQLQELEKLERIRLTKEKREREKREREKREREKREREKREREKREKRKRKKKKFFSKPFEKNQESEILSKNKENSEQENKENEQENKENEQENKENEQENIEQVELTQKQQKVLQKRVAQELAQIDRGRDETLFNKWEEKVRIWAQISDVFGDLGQMLGRGWDLSRGILRQTGWQNLLRLHELVKKLPQLQEIIQSLGRLQLSEEGESVAEKIFTPVLRLEEELLEEISPLIPTETKGIERSNKIDRMLPSEYVMLIHPKLRLLWHARRTEHALLTYRIEGTEIIRHFTERETEEESEKQHPRPERGPIIAIIDTSGSMHGLPERIAKAMVLEAARIANLEKRKCFLFAYSGPNQVISHELSISPEGIANLLEFLGFSFHGGNDEASVLAKVLERLKEEKWQKADIIFASDGEWPSPTKMFTNIEKAKEQGTRFHGVQIGNRAKTGLHSFCEPVHVFQNWTELNQW